MSLIAALLFFGSCKESVTALTAKITNSDSMAINWFKGNGSMDTVVAVKISSNKAVINSLAKSIGGYVTSKSNCGYDGSLHFFKLNKVIQDVRFRMNDNQCRYFEFVLDGKPCTTELNENAAAILNTLR